MLINLCFQLIYIPSFLLYDGITPVLKDILKTEKLQLSHHLNIIPFPCLYARSIFVLCMVVIMVCIQLWIWIFGIVFKGGCFSENNNCPNYVSIFYQNLIVLEKPWGQETFWAGKFCLWGVSPKIWCGGGWCLLRWSLIKILIIFCFYFDKNSDLHCLRTTSTMKHIL